MSDPNCDPAHDCLDHLVFQGHLGAPGIGTAYECSICHEDFHASGCGATPRPFASLDPSAFILDPTDCI